jgi:hypothetical protein
MISRMRTVLALALLLAAGCVVHERVPPPPDRPPPPPAERTRLLTKDEAVRVASDFVRERGLSVRRFKAKLDSHGHWRVDLKGDGGGDRAWVLVDARSGKVLKAKLKDRDRGWEEF